jgi:hypothetical protein
VHCQICPAGRIRSTCAIIYAIGSERNTFHTGLFNMFNPCVILSHYMHFLHNFTRTSNTFDLRDPLIVTLHIFSTYIYFHLAHRIHSTCDLFPLSCQSISLHLSFIVHFDFSLHLSLTPSSILLPYLCPLPNILHLSFDWFLSALLIILSNSISSYYYHRIYLNSTSFSYASLLLPLYIALFLPFTFIFLPLSVLLCLFYHLFSYSSTHHETPPFDLRGFLKPFLGIS